jgi:hypothetical protein
MAFWNKKELLCNAVAFSENKKIQQTLYYERSTLKYYKLREE